MATKISKKELDDLKDKTDWDHDRYVKSVDEGLKEWEVWKASEEWKKAHPTMSKSIPDDITEDELPKGEMFPAFDDKDTWAFELPSFKLFHLGHQHFVCISETPAEGLPPSFMDSLNKWLGVDGVLYVCLHDGETYGFSELKESESFTALFEYMLGKYMASAPIYTVGSSVSSSPFKEIGEAKKELIYSEPRKAGKTRTGRTGR